MIVFLISGVADVRREPSRRWRHNRVFGDGSAGVDLLSCGLAKLTQALLVRDPGEGVAADGTITTGVARSRVPQPFEPVLSAAVEAIAEAGRDASAYLYGSVATGQARHARSDVDLLTVGLGPELAAELGGELSSQFSGLCRGVEIAAAMPGDLAGGSDEAYGFRVFLRHYCVHLAGPDPAAALPAFPADARAARGFNGDIGRYLPRWRQQLESGTVAADLLGTRIARKTLLAVAGLVSVHDRTWTTSRPRAAQRWSEVDPGLAADLSQLLSWADHGRQPELTEVQLALNSDGIVAAIAQRFATLIGLWEYEG
jgi:hypothetical protein